MAKGLKAARQELEELVEGKADVKKAEARIEDELEEGARKLGGEKLSKGQPADGDGGVVSAAADASGDLVVSGKKKKARTQGEGAPAENDAVRGGDSASKSVRAAEVEDETDEDDDEVEDPSDELDDESDDEVDEAELDPSDRRTLYRSLAKSGEFKELADASPVLQHMTSVFGKSIEMLARAQVAIADEIEDLKEGMAVLMKSHAVMHKSLGAIPVKSVSPGIMGVLGQNGRVVDDKKSEKLTKSEIGYRLSRAVEDGKLSADYLAMWDSQGPNLLDRIPEDVRKAYDIPKSEDLKK